MNSNYPNLKFVSSIDKLIDILNEKKYDTNWIIGGECIYKTFITRYSNYINEVHITEFEISYDCDTFFDKKSIEEQKNIFKLDYTKHSNGVSYKIYISKS